VVFSTKTCPDIDDPAASVRDGSTTRAVTGAEEWRRAGVSAARGFAGDAM
jgi:hypothetical protein